jgi:hypothetical protein
MNRREDTIRLLQELGWISDSELDRLEELDAVDLEDVQAWRIAQVLRAARRPHD